MAVPVPGVGVRPGTETRPRLGYGYAPALFTPARYSPRANSKAWNARHCMPSVLKSVLSLSTVGESLPSRKTARATESAGAAIRYHAVVELPVNVLLLKRGSTTSCTAPRTGLPVGVPAAVWSKYSDCS